MPLPRWLQACAARPTEPPTTSLWQALQTALDAERKQQAAPEDADSLPTQLCQPLTKRLDSSQMCPAQAEGVVARVLSDRSGPYYVLKNPPTRTYLRLSPREYWVWEQLDGTHSIHDLVVAYFLVHGTFAFDLIVDLVRHLYDKQMLREQPQMVSSSLAVALKKRTPTYRLIWPARALLTREWALGNLDGFLTDLYRSGGWLFYTRPAQLLWLLVSVVGLYLFLGLLDDARFTFLGQNIATSATTYWLAAIPPILIHELGHALTTKHYGREVRRGGLMLYFGMPAAFVDTTDIWMEGKRARLAVTWAGPYTGFVIGGVCAILIWSQPELAIAPFLFQMASVALIISTLNLNPLLKLDGYYLLVDALEITNLRERSLAFIQHALLPKLLRRERFSRQEILFVVFGALATAWTIYILYIGLVVWNARVIQGVQAILDGHGNLATLGLNSVLILLAGSFLTWMGFRAFQLGCKVVAQIRRHLL